MRTTDVLRRLRWRLPVALLMGVAATIAMFPGLRTIILIAEAMIFGPLMSPSCNDRVIREFPSPNGRAVAQVLRTNCGATTPFVSSVAIKNLGEELDLKREMLFSVEGDGDDIEVIRDGNSDPTIVYDKPELIYKQVIVWRTEKISYRQR